MNAKTSKTGTRLDMVSFHANGGVSLSGGHPQMNLGNQLRIHRDAFTMIASFSKYKHTPIVITEADPDGCAACANTQNAYRNSPAYGAYIISMMKGSLDLEARLGVNLKGLVTWAFMFDDDEYFSVLRTLSTNGIDKPVLNAFKLLGALNGQRLPTTSSGARSLDDVLNASVRAGADIDSLASFDGSQVQVLVWNYLDDLVAVPPSPVHLTVSLPASFGPTVTVTHSRVDEPHGDTYTVWVKQGRPQAPTPAQRAELEQSMQPAVVEAAHSVPLANGTATVDFSLPRFGVSLVTFASPTAQAGGDGAFGLAGTTGAGSSNDGGGASAGSGSASRGEGGTVASSGAGGSGGSGNPVGSAGTVNGSSGQAQNGISSPLTRAPVVHVRCLARRRGEQRRASGSACRASRWRCCSSRAVDRENPSLGFRLGAVPAFECTCHGGPSRSATSWPFSIHNKLEERIPLYALRLSPRGVLNDLSGLAFAA